MTEKINIQNLSEIKNFIEENNIALREAIQVLEMLRYQILQESLQQPSQPSPLPARNYPGYTTPVRYGFMSQP